MPRLSLIDVQDKQGHRYKWRMPRLREHVRTLGHIGSYKWRMPRLRTTKDAIEVVDSYKWRMPRLRSLC